MSETLPDAPKDPPAEGEYLLAEAEKSERNAIDRARQIMLDKCGEGHFYGPVELERTFHGMKIDLKDIPALPPESEIERHAALGHILRLRISKAPDGSKLTMRKMHQLLQDEFTNHGDGKLYSSDDKRILESKFFTDEVPESAWAFTCNSSVPGTLGRNHLEQTKSLAEYAKTTLFEGEQLPQEYCEALQELAAQENEIAQRLMDNDWKAAADQLANLKINKLMRASPVEIMSDYLVTFRNTGKRMHENGYEWTATQSSDGSLIFVSGLFSNGVRIDHWKPGDLDHFLGVSFSQKLRGASEPKGKEKGGETTSPKEAETIIGADHFFGAEAVRKAFPGVILEPEGIPAIPFSREDLQRAKELGDSLRLRVSKAPDNGKLNIQKMSELLQPTFDRNNEGKILYDTDRYKKESFFTQELELCWVLTSDGVIPDSVGKDYLQQTERIAEYLRCTVYQGIKIPQQYEEAIKELDSEKDEIRRLINNEDRQEAAEKLANLKLNKLARRVPAEVIYDILVSFQNGNKRHLEHHYDWTSVRSSDGDLVDLGNVSPIGVAVDHWSPSFLNDELGVVLARKF